MATSSRDLAVAYLQGKALEYRRRSETIRHAGLAEQLRQRARDYELRLAQLEAATGKPAQPEAEARPGGAR